MSGPDEECVARRRVATKRSNTTEEKVHDGCAEHDEELPRKEGR